MTLARRTQQRDEALGRRCHVPRVPRASASTPSSAEVADPVGEGEKPSPRMPDEDFARRMMTYNIELLGPPLSL